MCFTLTLFRAYATFHDFNLFPLKTHFDESAADDFLTTHRDKRRIRSFKEITPLNFCYNVFNFFSYGDFQYI